MGEKVIPRIALCTPTRDVVNAEFYQAAMRMYGRFCTHYVATGQADIMHLTDLGTLLPDMRNSLAEEAIKAEATHILWLDSDMTFPHDALERLLAHGKPIVGAGYSQRKSPARPTTAKNGFWVYTEEDSTGLEAVDFLGMGCMLVETALYEAMPKPWHMLGYSSAMERTIGEDVFFCRRAREMFGVETFIDHDLTKEVLHIGWTHYSYQDALADRPELLEAQKRDGGKTSIMVADAETTTDVA